MSFLLKKIKRLAGRVLRFVKPGLMLLKRIFRIPLIPTSYPEQRGPAPAADCENLLHDYRNSEVAALPDTFVLYRIIGNDLYPRHARGQSRENIRFILENEPALERCEKRFVVNRIIDPAEERQIIDMLEKAGAKYLHIPFRWEEYDLIPWDIDGVPLEYAPYKRNFMLLDKAQQGRLLSRIYRHKNNYVMNNNGARNAALRDGRCHAKWVLPWDGNCFVTQSGWSELVRAVREHPEIPYYIVPMARIIDNNKLLDPVYRPAAGEEPQVMFRQDAALEFDPGYCYGRRPKIEFLWRLGVPGEWDKWAVEPWDLPYPPYAAQAGAFAYAGWVARLFSGNTRLEVSQGSGGSTLIQRGLARLFYGNSTLVERGLARVESICDTLDTLDKRLCEQKIAAATDSARLDVKSDLRKQLRNAAEQALGRGPFSVVDKTTLPPSGDRHDYWHPAPYFWPNPIPIPGLPYIHRDGRRVPGTRLYEPLSEKYDRTSLQRLFDDTYVTALAFRESGDARFAEHAAKLIRHWFLNPATAMNPHLRHAQFRGQGIIEFKDMYYFLDAVRIVEACGALSVAERREFRAWLARLLQWLVESPEGRRERSARNNHGTCYDLQLAAITLFLGEYALLNRTLVDSRFRIIEQIDAQGRQPREMTRSITAHYCCFNLQSWINLAEIAAAAGMDLWSFQGPGGQDLRQAMRWLLQHIGRAWPYEQIDPFDNERFFPIYYAYCKRFGQSPDVDAVAVPAAAEIKPLFYPHDGIRPFWQLSLT